MITTRTLTHVTAASALVAAAFMLQAKPVQAAPKAEMAAIVELPRVVITVRRVQPMQIVELPRVVITARRADAATRVVQAKAASKV